MKPIKCNVIFGIIFILPFAAAIEIYPQTGNPCDYRNILSDKTIRLDSVYYAPAWEVSNNYTCTFQNNALSLSLGDETYDAWQAQFFLSFSPPDQLIAGDSYCISFDIETTIDLPRVLIKIYRDGNNERFIEVASTSIKKGKQTVSGTYINEGDTRLYEFNCILFDLGYNPAGASIVISNIAIRGRSATSNRQIPENEIRIYPNPIKDKLFIHGLQHRARIKIINACGMVCIDTESEQEIDVTDLPPGMYFVTIEDKTFKIIKQ